MWREGSKRELASFLWHAMTGQEEWAQIKAHEIQSEHKPVFAVGVVKHWNSLPREVVESLSLEILRTCLDMVLGIIWLSTMPIVQRIWTRWPPEIPPSLNRSVVLWKLSKEHLLHSIFRVDTPRAAVSWSNSAKNEHSNLCFFLKRRILTNFCSSLSDCCYQRYMKVYIPNILKVWYESVRYNFKSCSKQNQCLRG